MPQEVGRDICYDEAREVCRQILEPYQPESTFQLHEYEAPAPPVEDLNGRPGKNIKNQVKSTFVYLYF